MADTEISSSTGLEHVNPLSGSESGIDRERLRYVTRLLGTQQGLSTALFGLYLFFADGGDIYGGPLRGWWPTLARLSAIAIYAIAVKQWIPRYYQNRFGFVEAQESGGKWFGLLLLAIVVLIFIGQPLGHYLDLIASRVHTTISDPRGRVDLFAPFLWIALFLGNLRWRLRSWERTQLCFLFIGTVIFSFVAVCPIWLPEVQQAGLWKVLNAGGLGLSLTAMGLYDHIVLVRTLPKGIAEGDDD